jgi:hypothetical protein
MFSARLILSMGREMIPTSEFSLNIQDESLVTVAINGHEVASAEVITEDRATVRVGFRVEAGHLPVALRPRLVDAVFALPTVRSRSRVQAAVALGDVDLIEAIRNHCAAMVSHAAGCTCVIEGDISQPPAEPAGAVTRA